MNAPCPTPKKDRYTSKDDAECKARFILFMGREKYLRVYQCACGAFHLTKVQNGPGVQVEPAKPSYTTEPEYVG